MRPLYVCQIKSCSKKVNVQFIRENRLLLLFDVSFELPVGNRRRPTFLIGYIIAASFDAAQISQVLCYAKVRLV